MAIVTYPLNNIDYTAADAEIYNSTRTSGVYANTDNLDLTITAARTVSISPGMAWIKNDDFAGKAIAVKDAVTLTFDAPYNKLNRIDRVVLRFSALNNETTLLIKKGVGDSSPTAPAVVQTPTVFELGLFDVAIPAGLTALTAANITDQRANGAVCGIMTDGVSVGGTYSDVLTATLSATWTTATTSTTPSSTYCDFFQSVTVAGVTADSNGVVGLAQTATKAQREAAASAALFKYEQSNGALVIAGTGNKPAVALPIEILVTK